MPINRSKRYEQIHDEVWDDYKAPPKHEHDVYWSKNYAPKWRNRVGIPRLVAERVFFEAASLLRSVNASLFRNDPEMQRLFGAAINSVTELAQEFSRQNWERFEGKGKP